jgi:folate-binding protein YgfZ
MNSRKLAVLQDRGAVRISGEDALKLLQGLITNDMESLKVGTAIFSGLLIPQGKILFEFFVVPVADRFILETSRARIGDLVKRLNFYKLRAKVAISDASADYAVLAIWDQDTTTNPPEWLVYPDPRLAALGSRALVPTSLDLSKIATASESDYHAHRIALGMPEGGRDYALNDAYPHEALYDQIAGVDFKKGCYVGQEIVSRMEHRGTARKRVVPVVGERPLTSGREMKAGAAAIGVVGSVDGKRGLALLRVDRAAEAIARGEPILAGDVPVRIELPQWVSFGLNAKAHGVEA